MGRYFGAARHRRASRRSGVGSRTRIHPNGPCGFRSGSRDPGGANAHPSLPSPFPPFPPPLAGEGREGGEGGYVGDRQSPPTHARHGGRHPLAFANRLFRHATVAGSLGRSTWREGHSLHVPLTTRGEPVRRACGSPRFGGNCPRSRLDVAVVCRPDRGANQSGLACRHVAPRRPRVDRRRAAAAGRVPDFLCNAARPSTRPDWATAPGRCHVVGRNQGNSHR